MKRFLEREYQKEIQFYRKYHQNIINWRIHSICIPMEWFSWLMFMRYLHPSFSWIISVGVSIYYLLIQQTRIACFSSFMHLLFALIVEQLYQLQSPNYLLFIAILLNLTSWSIQIFIGHYYFEKNSPGMATKLTLNSIVLSVLMAWDCD